MDATLLGRRIRLQRKRHGLRQSELAALSGVGTRFVSELENGKASVELGRALRVAETAGLDLKATQKTWSAFLEPDEF